MKMMKIMYPYTSEAGVIQRRKSRKKQGELQEELHKRQATKERKRSKQLLLCNYFLLK